jgi:cell division cycle protein 20 (cofactor of APC complex)
MLFTNDIRMRRPNVSKFVTDSAKICALTWSPDSTVCLWDINFNRRSGITASDSHRFRFIHSDPVKAISWCPWQKNLLATGGGLHDMSIKLWDTSNGILLNSIETGSKVCAIEWSDHSKELVSSHGYPTDQLTVWKYDDNHLTKQEEYRGHTADVLHLAKSPDGSIICSLGNDCTLRFWHLFTNPNTPKAPKNPLVLHTYIRKKYANSAGTHF